MCYLQSESYFEEYEPHVYHKNPLGQLEYIGDWKFLKSWALLKNSKSINYHIIFCVLEYQLKLF